MKRTNKQVLSRIAKIKMKKRFLCFLMSMVMLCCIIPSSFAVDVPETTEDPSDTIVTEDGNSAELRYKVSIIADSCGVVTITPAMPCEGETVFVVARPNTGHIVETITVVDESGTSIDTIATEYGIKYVSPAGNTTVTVTYINILSMFSDVTPAAWYYDDVLYLYQVGIMQGISPDTFGPNNTVSRAQIVTILYRLQGQPHISAINDFTDVKSGAYYASAVVWAEKYGLVQGYGNNLFGPNDPVTREQMATILYRYVKMLGHDAQSNSTLLNSYSDGALISLYAVEAMGWAVNVGLLQGNGANLMPRSGASRAEIAALVHRFCAMYKPL